nr:hypothetical protein [Tanacetum cinerariifolium]
PRRSKRRSGEKRSTLGEPSGKWDYYVRYDVPLNTTPIEEVTATGWGEEFSNDEVTPGKVTILSEVEEESDWDDDERSGGKTLVIQENFAQNQPDFLDEYLPQWDDQLATQKQRSELEWENPFAAKRAQIVKRHEEHAFPTSADDAESSTSYQPLPDAIMGPAVYPPARQNPQQTYRPDYQFGYPQGKGNTFYGGYGEYHNSQWTLPPAWTKSGVMLVLPADPGLWSDVISRWESITINRLNSQTWSDSKAKLAFVENLLGESEKLMWQQWRTAYPGAYSTLETIADDLQNITSQDIVSADFDDSSVYSISEGEGDVHQNISIMFQDTPIEEAAFMEVEESDDEQDIEEDYDSHHAFMFHPGPPTKIADMVKSAGS